MHQQYRADGPFVTEAVTVSRSLVVPDCLRLLMARWGIGPIPSDFSIHARCAAKVRHGNAKDALCI